jgi:hypothetical protein
MPRASWATSPVFRRIQPRGILLEKAQFLQQESLPDKEDRTACDKVELRLRRRPSHGIDKWTFRIVRQM